MGYENVRLWFAKDENEKIVTIDEVEDIHNTYKCPICGSDLLPKATQSKKITPHFAHVDADKCSSEHFIHWWFKNKLIVPGDNFKVVTDKERIYICKEILIEKSFSSQFGEYKPDVTIITESGETIYFEMAFSNKKKIKDYLDIWLDLKNTVVEIDIKDLIEKDALPSFKPLFSKGKCYNTKKNDIYYSTLGKYKEKLSKENSSKSNERIKKLDWLWDDIIKFKNNQVSIESITDLIDSIDNKDKSIVMNILKKSFCSQLYSEFKELKNNTKFERTLPRDHLLRNVEKTLNKELKLTDKELGCKLDKIAHHEEITFWFNGVKRKRKKVLYYTYDLVIKHGHYPKISIPINKRIMNINDHEQTINYLKWFLEIKNI